MDSLTQIVLGASVAAAVVPAPHRRAALLAGAALGTLPDLDSLPLLLLTDDPVKLMTMHRGLSHSLLVLPFLAWALWAWLRTRGGRVAQAPRPWFWAIQLALLTHPLLDALTVYGTQLWWPLPPSPVMVASLFIIDPAYTIWLLIGVVVAAIAGTHALARRALLAGLIVSSVYIGWSLTAKAMVDRAAAAALADMGLQDAPRFSVPTPFNTVLWRVVAMTPDGYVEGLRSLVADRAPMRFTHHGSDVAALAAVANDSTVQRLQWFNRGFVRAQVHDHRLILSDLRMGMEPDYSFNFAVAQRGDDGWLPLRPPEQLEWQLNVGDGLAWMWTRIWNEGTGRAPPQAPSSAASSAGSRP